MEEEHLKNIADKLDLIIKLLCSKLAEGKNKTDKILSLEALGVDRNLICELAQCPPAYVRSIVYLERKKNGNRKNKAKKKSQEAQSNDQPQ